ncbi:hypothetical protein DDB_G0290177 [Dictyostelium discoideum AX4]|uniref:Uncharacterized protein n=1 Tax=Dictyostelium discoideum TaxID=44689 RepID=Q54GG6_DICDI|nr:hypothetical protein DDB_G0290177 [Dictyostelium discoideum AX4]EAL62360.1 hypothetical protein DDB_G0290177 [Dictyostelium discoideum AX4]|eukprot:XP_635862.1 hypothetical protein DDB_G0290177 [Dictyostelium discoideum AX4]
MMIKNFILTVFLLVCISAFVNSQSTVGLSGAASVSLDGDVIRSYVYTDSNILSPSFTLTGVSVGGTILNGGKGGSVSVDTSIFKLDTIRGLVKVFPTYFFNYFDFKADTNQGINVNATSLSSIFMPTFIVEYEETNNQEGFQYGQDDLLGYVNLAILPYTLSKETTQLEVDGKDFTVYQVNLTSSGSKYANLFQMVFYVSGAPIDLADSRLSAEQSKVDILINGYYGSNNVKDCAINGNVITAGCISTGPSSNPNSRLALTSFYATVGLDFSLNGDGEINVDGTPLNAGFSWVSNAQVKVDGSSDVKTVNIIANTTASDADGKVFGSASVNGALSGKVFSKFLVHSFDAVRPNTLLWDPSIGASVDNSATSTIFSFGLILSLVLFVLFL